MGICHGVLTHRHRGAQPPAPATPQIQVSPPTPIPLPPHNSETNWYRTYSVAHRFCTVDRHASVYPLTRDGKIFPVAPDNYLLWAVRSRTHLIGVTAFGCVVFAELDESQGLYYYRTLMAPARAAIPAPADVLIALAEKFIGADSATDSQGIQNFLSIVGQLGPASCGSF